MSSFESSKRELLANIVKGIDFSPKGHIDKPVLSLVNLINGVDDFVTTSSCSGRISVYVNDEYRKGIKWLLVEHGPVTKSAVEYAVNHQCSNHGNAIMMKMESMIVHIQCRNLESGRYLHSVAMAAGFRESGLSVGQRKIMLAIRTTAFALELPIAIGTNMLLDDKAMAFIIDNANERLWRNFARTDKLLKILQSEWKWPVLEVHAQPGATISKRDYRWGHSSAVLKRRKRSATALSHRVETEFIIIGGYGSEQTLSTGGLVSDCSSSRKVATLISTDIRLSNRRELNEDSIECMHAASCSFVRVCGVGSDRTELNNRKEVSVASATATAVDDGGAGGAGGGGTRRDIGPQQVKSYLLLSGGRKAPTAALPILRVVEMDNGRPVSVQHVGGVMPTPRWGHTLTQLAPDVYFLYGGRDERQVFADGYLLRCSWLKGGIGGRAWAGEAEADLSSPPLSSGGGDEGDVECSETETLLASWELVLTEQDEASTAYAGDPSLPLHAASTCCGDIDSATMPVFPGRFFHAAVAVSTYIDSSSADAVLIHGGVLSLNDPRSCGHFFVVHPLQDRNRWSVLSSTSPTVGSPITEGSAHVVPETTTPNSVDAESSVEATNSSFSMSGDTLTAASSSMMLPSRRSLGERVVGFLDQRLAPRGAATRARQSLSVPSHGSMDTIPVSDSLSGTIESDDGLGLGDGVGSAPTGQRSAQQFNSSARPSSRPCKPLYLSRFAHTLTDIGGNCILVVGGASFNDDAQEHPCTALLRLRLEERGRLRGSVEPARVVSSTGSQHQQVAALGSSAETCLPCEACRVHHQVLVDTPEDAVADPCGSWLHIHGGGSQCLAFGPHYCQSVVLHVGYGSQAHRKSPLTVPVGVTPSSLIAAHSHAAESRITRVVGGQRASATNDDSNSTSRREAKATEVEPSDVIFAPTKQVKPIKILLEKHGLLDKSRRITIAEQSALEEAIDVNLPVQLGIGADPDAAPIADTQPSTALSEGVLDHTECDRPPAPAIDSSVREVDTPPAPAIDSSVREVDRPPALDLGPPVNVMSIPVVAALATELMKRSNSCHKSTGIDVTAGPATIDGGNSVDDSLDTVCRELASILGRSSIRLGSQRVRLNKLSIVSGYRKAADYLQQAILYYRLPPTAQLACPLKYELVGDVLMLPGESLCGEGWDELLKVEEATNGPDDTRKTLRYTHSDALKFLTGLAACFTATRVAKKARVDPGPKRESHIRLLLPCAGRPATTGPSAPGWVTVQENGIHFGFDITRVMFCSGNVTERMRMGREKVAGQVIVDLYCGVGYYTLPFLVHGKAAHVHACEWNPNSILAFRSNLERARVSPSRCSVYEGDNALSAPALASMADRVCLGLLPSSVAGWPLAAIVLKPTGGLLHVHENVKDEDIHDWVAATCVRFQELFQSENKPMEVQCRHLERVKSYAPHIIHIVADLMCTPRR